MNRAGMCRHCSKWISVTEGMCAPCRRRTQTCVGQLELPIVTIAHNRGMPEGRGIAGVRTWPTCAGIRFRVVFPDDAISCSVRYPVAAT
jgi:hypothetical protein